MGYTDKLGKRIQEDLAKYSGRREIVRADFMEVLTVRHLSPDQMHPNPEDEFCDPDVGPNEEILERYVDEDRENLEAGADSFEEPIMVAKMKEGDYMIINGHHRWAAAVKAELDRVRVVIANPGTEDLVGLL